ncbi:hypothetical protein ACERK3_13900 [Phycisphaerales bacterium AB-hyl4]|uniref:Uncharacterized protein n=1 Tax=Natronomicrosphaera hydrolytica TaxID=3242702 RepID=A0ABV4UA38_9BACT
MTLCSLTALTALLHSLTPALLAWRPLLDPLPIDNVWMILLLPLSVGVAIVYKTIKLNDMATLPRQAAVLSAQIIVFMLLAAAIIWVVVEVA